jgi:hypothetical protein
VLTTPHESDEISESPDININMQEQFDAKPQPRKKYKLSDIKQATLDLDELYQETLKSVDFEQ